MMGSIRDRISTIVIIVVIVMNILTILLSHVPLVAGADTTPWSSEYYAWFYRTPIIIYNPNNYTLTNFQVRITLNDSWLGWQYASNNSIRFALPNGTSIPYWIQNWNSTAKTAVIWIKVPELPANSNTTIYMYYDNRLNVTSKSNGSRVFNFFDDFTTFNTSCWKTIALDVSHVTSALILSSYGSGLWDILYTKYNTTEPIILEAKMKYITSKDVNFGVAMFEGTPKNNTPWGVLGIITQYNSIIHLNYRVGGRSVEVASAHINFSSLSSYKIIALSKDGDYYSFSVDGVTISKDILTKINVNSIGIIATPSISIEVDWIRVRKYAPKMPIALVGNQIEIHGYPVTFNIRDENGNNILNATLIIDTQVYNINSGETLIIGLGLHNITVLKPPEYTTVSIKNINITNTTALNITLPIAKYNLTFYAFANNSPISNYPVYITYSNNTTILLGIFSNGESATLPYGLYVLTLNQTPFVPVQVVVNLTHDMNVTFKTQRGNFSLVLFNFYNAVSSSPINNVTVIIRNSTSTIQHVVTDHEGIWLHYGSYNVTVEKAGYHPETLVVTVDKTTTYLTFYLQPETQSQIKATLPGPKIPVPEVFANSSNESQFIGARVFNDLMSFSIGKATKDFLHLSPLFAIFIPLILTIGLATATWYVSRNGLVVLGALGISMTFWYLIGVPVQLSLINTLSTIIIFFIAWAIWGFYRTKEVGE